MEHWSDKTVETFYHNSKVKKVEKWIILFHHGRFEECTVRYSTFRDGSRYVKTVVLKEITFRLPLLTVIHYNNLLHRLSIVLLLLYLLKSEAWRLFVVEIVGEYLFLWKYPRALRLTLRRCGATSFFVLFLYYLYTLSYSCQSEIGTVKKGFRHVEWPFSLGELGIKESTPFKSTSLLNQRGRNYLLRILRVKTEWGGFCDSLSLIDSEDPLQSSSLIPSPELPSTTCLDLFTGV